MEWNFSWGQQQWKMSSWTALDQPLERVANGSSSQVGKQTSCANTTYDASIPLDCEWLTCSQVTCRSAGDFCLFACFAPRPSVAHPWPLSQFTWCPSLDQCDVLTVIWVSNTHFSLCHHMIPFKPLCPCPLAARVCFSCSLKWTVKTNWLYFSSILIYFTQLSSRQSNFPSSWIKL